jgi:hypothetical protein
VVVLPSREISPGPRSMMMTSSSAWVCGACGESPRGRANAVATEILDPAMEMTTREAEFALDPFAGCGMAPRIWIESTIEPSMRLA